MNAVVQGGGDLKHRKDAEKLATKVYGKGNVKLECPVKDKHGPAQPHFQDATGKIKGHIFFSWAGLGGILHSMGKWLDPTPIGPAIDIMEENKKPINDALNKATDRVRRHYEVDD